MNAAWFFPLFLAGALQAGPPVKPFIFLAGAEPETIAGKASLGDSGGAVELTRSAPSYDIESMRTFQRYCPAVAVTTRRDKADVIVHVERDEPNPTTPFVMGNKVAVFSLDGELLFATRARLARNATKNACRAILDYVKR